MRLNKVNFSSSPSCFPTDGSSICRFLSYQIQQINPFTDCSHLTSILPLSRPTVLDF
uniref:Uncharacterized protein n=1 Tax=Arundo donax TaxID=35708 RepID=A0A0A9EMH9_ARUDO